MTYTDADRERWADDHWDYIERIGAIDEDVHWCSICRDDKAGGCTCEDDAKGNEEA